MANPRSHQSSLSLKHVLLAYTDLYLYELNPATVPETAPAPVQSKGFIDGISTFFKESVEAIKEKFDRKQGNLRAAGYKEKYLGEKYTDQQLLAIVFRHVREIYGAGPLGSSNEFRNVLIAGFCNYLTQQFYDHKNVSIYQLTDLLFAHLKLSVEERKKRIQHIDSLVLLSDAADHSLSMHNQPEVISQSMILEATRHMLPPPEEEANTPSIEMKAFSPKV
jgi:hypothetical protein